MLGPRDRRDRLDADELPELQEMLDEIFAEIAPSTATQAQADDNETDDEDQY